MAFLNLSEGGNFYYWTHQANLGGIWKSTQIHTQSTLRNWNSMSGSRVMGWIVCQLAIMVWQGGPMMKKWQTFQPITWEPLMLFSFRKVLWAWIWVLFQMTPRLAWCGQEQKFPPPDRMRKATHSVACRLVDELGNFYYWTHRANVGVIG